MGYVTSESSCQYSKGGRVVWVWRVRAIGMGEKDVVSRGMSVERAKGLAHAVTETGEDGELTFLNRLAARLKKAEVDIPTVTVEFRDLCVQADALVGSAALPTLSNVVVRALKVSVTFGEVSGAKWFNWDEHLCVYLIWA